MTDRLQLSVWKKFVLLLCGAPEFVPIHFVMQILQKKNGIGSFFPPPPFVVYIPQREPPLPCKRRANASEYVEPISIQRLYTYRTEINGENLIRRNTQLGEREKKKIWGNIFFYLLFPTRQKKVFVCVSVLCVCVSFTRNCSLVYNVCCSVTFPTPRQCKTCTYKAKEKMRKKRNKRHIPAGTAHTVKVWPIDHISHLSEMFVLFDFSFF